MASLNTIKAGHIKLNNRVILILVIIVASLLRFINYCEVPFTHDEFSALFRLNFSSFSELIDKGIKIDGHPAGIQVFLYYWTKIFGISEWIVKLPFTIMGIISVYLVYLIGKKWFNETAGLISASFIASMQFTIMYSQIARPYISGLFFCLLMVNFWSAIILSPDKHFYRNSLIYIVASSLCAYNHHFSLLMAAIVGISGLFFIHRSYLWKYILSGTIIFLLYLPHLNIFFYQLNLGGVEGWLGKPENRFLIDFLFYIFNFSFLSVILVFALILFSAFKSRSKNFSSKKLILFTCWFLIPFLTGFIYSKYYYAVLQYSVLIFSAPFLLFVLFGHIKNQSPLKNLIITILILSVNLFSLIVERKHYNLFYNSPYEKIITDCREAQNNNDSIIAIIDSHKKITDYYMEKLKPNIDFVWFDSFKSINEFIQFLEVQSKINNKLYLGCLSNNDPLTVPVIMDYFPELTSQKNYAGGTTYIFSKGIHTIDNIIDIQNFESEPSDKWSSIKKPNYNNTENSEGIFSYRMDSLTQWSPAYSCLLNDIISGQNNFIDISVKIKCEKIPEEALLVASLETASETVHWSGSPLNNYVIRGRSPGKWVTIHHSVKLSDIPLNSKNMILKTFIWNKGKKSFLIDNFTISLREGNPFIYGLIEKI